MPEAVTNDAVMAALTSVNTAVTALRADIDGLKAKKPDVIDTERQDRINAAVGGAQEVLDKARRARQSASATLEGIKAARAARPAASGRPGVAVGLPRGPIRCHLTGNPLTHEQIEARGDYRKAFMSWAKSGKDGDLIVTAPKAAMQTQIAKEGGFLVPMEMENAVIQLGGLYSAMRQLCEVRQITVGNSMRQPVNVQGATFGWAGNELSTRTETEADDLAMMEWHLMEAYAQPKVTNILLQDAAFDVEGWLNEGISREMAEGEGVAFISGGGTYAPRGIQSYTMVANASWVWGKIGFITTGVAAAITDSTHNGYDALIDMITGTHRRYLPGAHWMMSRTTEAVIRKVKDENDNYLWQPSVTLAQPSSILGFPVETDDNVPGEGANNFPIMFGDFAQAYRIVDKAGMEMIRDNLTDKGRTAFYTTKRVGGGMKNFEAVKFLKCST